MLSRENKKALADHEGFLLYLRMCIEKFILPDDEQEYKIARERMEENGGGFGYLENGYPCGIFTKKELTEIDFDKVTIIYGGNGSGKTTLLNLIAKSILWLPIYHCDALAIYFIHTRSKDI